MPRESRAKPSPAGADLILVLGGDGTINEAVNGMVHSNAALGILPAGTANVLAMELGLGSRLERAIERLLAVRGTARRGGQAVATRMRRRGISWRWAAPVWMRRSSTISIRD